jgi:hypothetical protein
MAYIAFDLDATLGFFELTNPLAFLWSPDYLENPEQSAVNKKLNLSSKLKTKLQKARATFANSLLKDEHLLNIVLRSNLDSIFTEILKAKKKGMIKSIIIYSNTSVTYSMELAKHLIEHMYKTPNLIGLMADHWHPLRFADRPRFVPKNTYVQPNKTIETVKLLFQTSTRSRIPPSVNKIMFVDDRNPKHKLQEQEREGLTYVVPSAFYPKFTEYDVRCLIFLALEALNREYLLSDREYIANFCNRTIPYDYTKRHRIKGFPDLFMYVWNQMIRVQSPTFTWISDSDALEKRVHEFLQKI